MKARDKKINGFEKEIRIPIKTLPETIDEVEILASKKGESVNEIINRYIHSGIANDKLILMG
jgi:hypothetical protein